MSTVLEGLPLGSRVAVIRLRSLGDSVLTIPALALLKACRPDLRIGVVLEDRFRAVFNGNPDIDDILKPSAAAIFSWRPKLTINFHGGARSMALTLASGATRRVGFGHHRYSFIYSHRIPRAQEILGQERTVHTAEHLASAMFWLGAPRREIPRAKLFLQAGQASHTRKATTQARVVIHPFASETGKTWPAERFLAVALELKEGGLEPVFLAGPRDDTSAFARFTVWQGAPMEDVKSLMAGAHLFIGNDSGPAHIAAAFGVPCVVLFGSSDPLVWAPWRTEARVLQHQGGIDAIQIHEVREAVHSLKVAA
ncbi:MAG: glycosyltransferase family 9 protein [Bryobacterales bacterium]|nr:glycosyltransferase family 9 protein [Bryobacterales bacterium]